VVKCDLELKKRNLKIERNQKKAERKGAQLKGKEKDWATKRKRRGEGGGREEGTAKKTDWQGEGGKTPRSRLRGE